MATLDDLQDVLKSIDRTMIDQKSLLTDMISAQATRDRLSSVNNSTTNPANGAANAAGPSFGQSFGAAAGSGAGAGAGLMGIGAGIAGLLAGLVLTDIGIKWITDISGADGSGLKYAFKLFNDSVGELKDPNAIIALGAILAAGTAAGIAKGAGGVGAGIGIASIMTGIGAGISGLFIGLTAGGKIVDLIEAIPIGDGDGLVSAFRMFNNSVSELKNENAIIALGALITAGTAAGLLTNVAGVGAGIGIASVMTGIGAGIAGLFIGLAAGGKIVDLIEAIPIGDGNGLVSVFKMFNDSIMAIDIVTIERLKTLIPIVKELGDSAGGPLMLGPVLTGLGTGIAGFFVGLGTGGKIVDIIEAIPIGDGDGLVSLFKMFNDSVIQITPEAVGRLKDIATLGTMNIGSALAGLSAGIVALFGSQGFTDLGGIAMDGIKGAVDLIFGTDYKSENTSIFQGLVDGLEPIKGFDVAPVNKFIDTLDSLTAAFERLANIDVGSSVQANVFSMLKNIGGVLGIMPYLLRGGEYPGQRLGWGDNIDFGPEGAGGLLALKDEDLELLKTQVSKLYGALDMASGSNQAAAVSVAPAVQAATTESSLANNTSQIGILTTNTDKMIELSQNILKSLEVIAAGSPSSAQQAAAQVVANSGNTDARAYVAGSTYNINDNRRSGEDRDLGRPYGPWS